MIPTSRGINHINAANSANSSWNEICGPANLTGHPGPSKHHDIFQRRGEGERGTPRSSLDLPLFFGASKPRTPTPTKQPTATSSSESHIAIHDIVVHKYRSCYHHHNNHYRVMFFGGDPFEHFAHGGGGGRRSGMGRPSADVDTTKLYETLGVCHFYVKWIFYVMLVAAKYYYHIMSVPSKWFYIWVYAAPVGFDQWRESFKQNYCTWSTDADFHLGL